MAEVAVRISGLLHDKLSRTSRPVVIEGKGTALSIEDPPGSGEPPLGIWGPTDPRPTPPIHLPPPGGGGPVDPGYGIPIGGHPAHPIYLPDPPEVPEAPPGTPPNSVIKGAPEGGWGYFTNEQGSVYAAYNPPHAGPKR